MQRRIGRKREDRTERAKGAMGDRVIEGAKRRPVACGQHIDKRRLRYLVQPTIAAPGVLLQVFDLDSIELHSGGGAIVAVRWQWLSPEFAALT